MYESLEKERFIYGKQWDGTNKTADEIMELEQMWVIDGKIQKYRGFMQGHHRGLYKDYDWDLPESCLSR